MRYLILGAGALGGYFGARLLKGGADVTFLVRPARAAQLQRDGLVVKAQDGEIRVPVKVIQDGQIDGSYDVVLLTCKAYDLDGAINAIAPAVGTHSVVLPLLNGVHHINMLSDRFGPQRVLSGITAINAALMSDGTIVESQVKVNMTMIGEVAGAGSPRCAAIQKAFGVGGLPITVSDNMPAMMWMKFFGYSCAAAIASITRSRAGVVVRAAAGASLVSAVIAECTRIVTAEGYPPPENIPGVIRGLFSQPDSTYGPSMLIDMEDGRPTEGDHTIGDLVARAAQRGVDAPIFGAALCNLQAYEINRQARL